MQSFPRLVLLGGRIVVEVMYVAVANVLTDKLHFGKVKVQQTLRQIEKVFDMLAEGRMSLDDIKKLIGSLML